MNDKQQPMGWEKACAFPIDNCIVSVGEDNSDQLLAELVALSIGNTETLVHIGSISASPAVARRFYDSMCAGSIRVLVFRRGEDELLLREVRLLSVRSVPANNLAAVGRLDGVKLTVSPCDVSQVRRFFNV